MSGLGYLAPEIILIVGAMTAVLQAGFLNRDHQHLTAVTAMVALVAAAAATVVVATTTAPTLTFESTWVMDDITSMVRLGTMAVAAVTVLLSPGWMRTDQRHAEWYGVVLFGTAGAMLMAGAADVMQLLVGVLLSSVTTTTMVGYHRRSAASTEAGIKTFLVGSLANVLLLLGSVMFFGLAGTTSYAAAGPVLAAEADPGLVVVMVALVVVGLTFKIGAVPAHSWLPDAAQGAPAPAAAFVTVAPKIGAVIGLFRLLSVLPADGVAWPALMAVMAAVTMTVGNLAALWQQDLRRLLGWPSVSQAGYALMPLVAIGRDERVGAALVIFLLGYAAAQMAAFGVVVVLRGRTRLAHYEGLAGSHPWLAAVMLLGLLSLVGIPPTAGFAGKLLVFAVTIDAGYGWLALLAVVNTVVSLFYYLRVAAPMVFAAPGDRVALLGRPAAVGTALGAVATLAVGLGAQALLGAIGGAGGLP